MIKLFYTLLIFSLVGIASEKYSSKNLQNIKKLASEGDSQAQFDLGYYYRFQPIFLDEEEALKVDSIKNEKLCLDLMKMSSAQGNVDAMSFLAKGYYLGSFHDKGHPIYDKKQATDLLEKIKTKDEGRAYLVLALVYSFGAPVDGLKKDIKKSMMYYEKSAKLGNEEALTTLIDTYLMVENSLDLEDPEQYFNIPKAIKLLKEHANKNNGYNSTLGDLYLYGYDELKVDLKLSKSYYEKDMELGNSKGYYGMAEIYYTGSGVKRDVKKAIELLTKAIKLFPHDYACQNRLALYYASCDIESLRNPKQSIIIMGNVFKNSKNPTESDYYTLAIARSAIKDFKGALQAMKAAIVYNELVVEEYPLFKKHLELIKAQQTINITAKAFYENM